MNIKLKRLGSLKLILILAILSIILIILSIAASSAATSSLFLAIAVIFGASSFAAILFRQRNLEIERKTDLAKVKKGISSVIAQTKKVPDTAGSVSKLRAKQEIILEKIDETTTMLTSVSGAQPQVPTPQEDKGKNRDLQDEGEKSSEVSVKSQRIPRLTSARGHQVTDLRDGLLEKSWQLKHELILPYSAKLDNYDFIRPEKNNFLAQLKVAVILDEFSHASISPEVQAIPLTPKNWREQLEKNPPDVFLCESVWRGMPNAESPWKGSIYGSIRFGYENRKILIEIIQYCKTNGIPTVFWNKEDPTHFADRVNDFVSTALKFDYVFTTAVELIPEYNKLLGREAAGVLPFGSQPRIFHPGGEPTELNTAVFAGSWYKAHSKRSQVQKQLFAAVQDAGAGLAIYDRQAGKDDDYFGYPEEFGQFVQPAVPYTKTADLYRKFEFGLSINTATDSRTMLARRAFEMVGSGCGVITNYCEGVETFFGGNVLSLGSGDSIDRQDIEKLKQNRVAAMNDVLRNHSYEARLVTAFNSIGLDIEGSSAFVSVVFRVRNLEDIDVAKAQFSRTRRVAADLVLLVDRRVETHKVQQFYSAGIDAFTSVVSEKYWIDQGVNPSSVFTHPYLLICDPRNEIPSVPRIERALAHSVYSTEPVHAAERENWPGNSVRRVDSGCVIQVRDFEFHLKNDFERGVVLDV